MLDIFHINLIIFWILYVSIHSIMAALWFKDIIKKRTGKYFTYYRFLYSCFATILLLLLLIYQYLNKSKFLFTSTSTLKIVCTITGIAGAAIMWLSIKKYFFALSGVAAFRDKQLPQNPIVQGPNAYVRHPLYSGTLLLLWSLFFWFPLVSNLIAVGVITAYLLFAGIPLEEKKLEIEFGESYKQYQNKVPKLLPFFKSRNSI